jgi:hypothetical protein
LFFTVGHRGSSSSDSSDESSTSVLALCSSRADAATISPSDGGILEVIASAFSSVRLGISSPCGEGNLEIGISAVSSAELGNAVFRRLGRGKVPEVSAGRLRDVLVEMIVVIGNWGIGVDKGG